jgi:hypothetical protein
MRPSGGRFFLSSSSSDVRLQIAGFAFSFIQGRDAPQCLLGKHALAGDLQVLELAWGLDHVAYFGDAEGKAGFIASVIVANQLAFLVI